MSGFGSSEILVKPTLPPKIIQLRKMSQENHVKRMKIAHQRKELQTLYDVSLFPSPSIQGSNSASFRTPFTTPRTVSESKSIQSLTEQTRKSASVKSSFHYSTPNFKVFQTERNNSVTKLADLKKSQRMWRYHEDCGKYNTPVGDSFSKIPTAKYSPDIESNTISSMKFPEKRSQTLCKVGEKIHFEHGEKSVALDSTTHKEGGEFITTSERVVQDTPSRIAGQTFSGSKTSEMLTKDITNKWGGNMQPHVLSDKMKLYETPEKQILYERKCWSSSKIPVALSRLSQKEGKKTASTSRETHHKFQENSDNTDSIKSVQTNNLNKSSRQMCTPKSEKMNRVLVESNQKASGSFAPDITSFSIENFPMGIGDGPLKNKDKILTPNKISSVSNWLNNMMDGGVQATRSPDSKHEGSLCDNETYTVSSYDSISQSPTKDEGKNPKHLSSESDDAEEFYDTKEIESEVFNADGSYLDQKKWRNQLNDEDKSSILEASDEDKSSIAVPSDEDLDLQEHRESFFRDLPGYPNTPYYLRYPRNKIKKDANLIRSDGKEMADALRQLRIGKSVKKSSNSTPRRKKNVKVKIGTKTKKHLFGMKYHA